MRDIDVRKLSGGRVAGLVIAGFALWSSAGGAATPTVTKVEPPNWWLGRSDSTVRLLIRGTGLKDAQVRAERGLEVFEPRPSENGTYLFVDVKPHKVGSYTLKVLNHDGSAAAAFEVLTPLTPKGRFQGFNSNDLMYMIVTDRFADGDPLNDDPAVSKGLFDRTKPRFYHGGDFQGIIDHLPYLKDLGVSALWITPVYDSANALEPGPEATGYHGYHPVDFYAVDEHFGDLQKLRELVDKAHESGIKVILDMVMNHTGPQHPWVSDPPLATWFHGTKEKHLNETFQIWTLIDPHAGPMMRYPVLDGWFSNHLPDLNQDEPEVARYLIQNTLWWIASTGIDGVRADAMPYVPRGFWRDWNAAIRKEYPNLKTVGEVFDGDPSVVSFFQGGAERFDGVDSGMPALFDFPLYGSMRHVFGENRTVGELAYVTGHDSLYTNSNDLVTFLGNHDVPRFANEPGSTMAGMKLGYAYLLTTRGVPMFYYGDEIALRGGGDPENRKDFPGGWKDDIRSAFDPKTRTKEETELFEYVRKIALLRQSTPELRTGKLTQIGMSRDAYIFTRGSLIVLLNNAERPVKVEAPAASGTWKNLLDVSENVAVHDQVMTITIPPRTVMIMKQR